MRGPAGRLMSCPWSEAVDRVFIRDLTLSTLTGIYPWEAEVRQRVILNLEIFLPAGKSPPPRGDIESTADYAAVIERVKSMVEPGRFLLLEDLAEDLADLLLREFRAAEVEVQVCKPDAHPGATRVGVLIRRKQPKTASGSAD